VREWQNVPTLLDTSGGSDSVSSEGSHSDGFPKNPFSTDSSDSSKEDNF
jgi:hypothetical protein